VPVCLDEESGARELIDNGHNGFLVSDRTDDFYSAIEALKNFAKWKEMSLAARRTVLERYSYDRLFPRWATLISSMVAGEATVAFTFKKRDRVSIPEGDEMFQGYPSLRPSRPQVLRKRISKAYHAFRQAVRPRARLRGATSRFRGQQ
jgi:hypothetical protein